MEYPTTRIVSVKSAMKWIEAEWAERFDGDWYVARDDGHYLATERQSQFLDKAEEYIQAMSKGIDVAYERRM